MHSKYRLRGLAVLLVLYLAAVACGLPFGSAPPTPTTTLPTVPAVTPDLSTATLPAPQQAEVGEVLIYMIALEDNGASGPVIGCGDSIIPIRRAIAPTRQPLAAALNELLAQKSQFYGESGLFNALWQSNLVVESAQVDASGTATAALTGQVKLSGTCDTPRFKAQIEQTMLSVAGVSQAVILLNGQPIDQALSQQ